MKRIFLLIIKRDITLAFQKGSGSLNVVAFFIIASSLFAFGVGADHSLLPLIGCSVVWVCALLSCLMNLPRLFEDDLEDGSLHQLLLQQTLPSTIIMAKLCAYWLTTALPLLVAVLPIGVMFQLPQETLMRMVASLMLGTPSLVMIGAIGAALTLGVKKGGALLFILVLPLCIPVLIFGVNASQYAPQFYSASSLLCALLLFFVPLGVMAITALVKLAVEEC